MENKYISNQIKIKNSFISFKNFLFSISVFLIFFAYDGSFNIQVIFPIILIIFLIDIFKNNNTLLLTREHKLLILLGLVYFVSFISTLIVDPKLITITSFIRILYVNIIFLYFICATYDSFNKNQIRRVINCYIIVSIIVSLLIIYNFLNGMQGKITIITFFKNKIDPNTIASFTNIASLFIFLKIYYCKNIIKKSIVIFELFIVIFGIFLTGSRASFLALIISLFVQLILLQFMNKKIMKNILKVILSLILLSLLGYFLYKNLPEFIINRFFINSYIDESNIQRISIWTFALKGILKKPILGYGAGNFNYYIVQAFPGLTQSVVAHNTYLDILVESGIIGFTLFILFLFNIIKKLLNERLFLLIPIIINLFITSFIIGADRTVYFWNTLILLYIIEKYFQKDSSVNLTDILFKGRK